MTSSSVSTSKPLESASLVNLSTAAFGTPIATRWSYATIVRKPGVLASAAGSAAGSPERSECTSTLTSPALVLASEDTARSAHRSARHNRVNDVMIILREQEIRLATAA